MSGAPWTWSARALAEAVRTKRIGRDEAAESGFRERAPEWEPQVHAIVHTDASARVAAATSSAAYPEGPLSGVGVLVKDNLCSTDYPTTCGSRILAGWQSPYDSTAVARLRTAGAVLVGKGNMDEFAMGSSTEFSAYGPTRNPYDLERVPGGSSGGPAAAVAYGLVPIALGSDTGGSVRQPAAFCGVYGLKPTYGRISRYGLVAFGSSLDQVGIFARHVGDVAEVFRAIAGEDPFDASCRPTPVPDVTRWDAGVEGLRFGWPENLWREGVDAPIVEALERSASALERAGAVRVPFEFLPGRFAVAAYYLLATAEASSNLARFDGVRYGHRHVADELTTMYTESRGEGFGPEVRRRILLGTYALSAGYHDEFYAKAQKARTRIVQEYASAFSRCDLMLMPATPTLAFKLGEKTDDPLAMYLSDVFTIGANLAGIPGLTVPTGLSPMGLPVGVQLLGPMDSEPALLRAARALEAQGDKSAITRGPEREVAWPGKR